MIAACIPTIFVHCKCFLSETWSRSFGNKSNPSQPSKENKFPLRKVPIRNLNSISEALRGAEQDYADTRGTYAHETASWRIASGDSSRLPENGIKVDTAFTLDDLESGGNKDRLEKR